LVFLFKIGFFTTNRNKDKDKREKKTDKRPTVNNTKINKLPSKQNSRDESNDFMMFTDNKDDFVRISSNDNKTKCVNILRNVLFVRLIILFFEFFIANTRTQYSIKSIDFK